MSRPRLQPQHYSVALLLGAAGAVLAVVLFGQIPGRGRWAAELGNSAHGPAFAIVTLILIALLRRVPGRNASILRDYSLAIAVALLGALAVFTTNLGSARERLGHLADRTKCRSLSPVSFGPMRLSRG